MIKGQLHENCIWKTPHSANAGKSHRDTNTRSNVKILHILACFLNFLPMTYRSHLSWWYVGEMYRANALKTSENCDRNARTLLLQAGVEKANSVSILNISKTSDQILHDSHHGTPALNEHEWTTLLYAAIELEFSST